MSYFFKNGFWAKKTENRRDVARSDLVEKTRLKFGLKKGEMAKLMGLSNQHYTNCLNRGHFVAFRFYSAVDAIENQALKRAVENIIFLHKVKTGLNIDNIDSALAEVIDNDEIEDE
jgi:hypothetical protein